jgi:hypothetical protein
VLVIHENKGLFLKMDTTYEYRSIVQGSYTGAKLYHYLSLITPIERIYLKEHPFVQWKRIFPNRKMPGNLYHKLKGLQVHLDRLFELIPCTPESMGNHLLTIPKGRQYGDETSTDTALRELREETGIELTSDRLTGPYLDKYVGTDGNTYTTYTYGAFLMEKPTIILSGEFSSFMWVSLTEHELLKR